MPNLQAMSVAETRNPQIVLLRCCHDLLNRELLPLYLTPSFLSWEFVRNHFLGGSVFVETLKNGSWGKYWGNYVPYIGHNLFTCNNICGPLGCRRLHHYSAALL